jgi:hypothetical protein
MSQSSDTEGSRTPPLSGLLTVVGWIGAGAIVLATLLLVLDLVVDLPFSRPVAVGLGLAMGGGLGGVANLLRGGETAGGSDETMTVDVEGEGEQTPTPRPADLFDDHPDPILYYATEGHGPVVRAANEAFGETFDVPPDRLSGTPLSEALLVAGEDTVDADAVTAGGLDVIVRCEIAEGSASFRLRTVGAGDSGYLLYTPVRSG